MTTTDGAMCLFLTNNQNTRWNPNENYAREFMELFCLGVDNGYTQADVVNLARAFTGYDVNWDPDSPGYGDVTFQSGRHDPGNKTLFGQTAKYNAVTATDLVLAQPGHAPFLVGELWSQFIVTPINAPRRAELAALYVASDFKLRPLVRAILGDPLLFESLGEPNMVKQPVVYLVGAQRALGAPMKWFWQREVLADMQQLPYSPPNVAGWEGGLSWLNTNAAQARYDAILRLLYLKHTPANANSGYPGSVGIPDPGTQTPLEAFDAAYTACGEPWLSAASRLRIIDFAAAHAVGNATARQRRAYNLRALILGGPDGQVM